MTRSAPHPARETASPSSWEFWRNRLGRALIVGALALTAAQVLPALPRDQHIRLTAPAGVRLTSASLTYFSKEDGAPLSGIRLVPATPTENLTHTTRLPDDDYLLSVDATGVGLRQKPARYILTETVTLSSGKPARVYLKTSKPSP